MFKELFIDHPRQVRETYFQHFLFAMRFSIMLIVAAIAALIHAFVPALFEKTASSIVADLFQRTHRQRH